MNIRTELREVSIYRRGCTVRRYGEAQLEAGRHQLRIEGLTAGTDASSVRIMLSQPLHGSNVQVRWPDEEEQKALCEEIDQKIALCEARILACSAQEEVWKTNTDLSANTNASLETISAYADALPAKLEEIFLKKAELEKEKEKLLKERQKIQKEIARPYVSMFAECDKAGTYQIIAEYYEPHASWNPVYEIRAEEDRPLNIRLRAAMRQNTGGKTGGDRRFVAPMALAAKAFGATGYFFEVHPRPDEGLSDAANMLELDKLEPLIVQLLQ